MEGRGENVENEVPQLLKVVFYNVIASFAKFQNIEN